MGQHVDANRYIHALNVVRIWVVQRLESEKLSCSSVANHVNVLGHLIEKASQRAQGLRLLFVTQKPVGESEHLTEGLVTGHGAQNLTQSVEGHLLVFSPHVLHILTEDSLHFIAKNSGQRVFR